MTVLPFVCLGIGIISGCLISAPRFAIAAEKASTIALVLLMIAIGLGIGIDEEIVSQFGQIGLNCVVISLSAIAGSVLLTFLCEKTVLPLERLDREMEDQALSLESAGQEASSEERQGSALVWIMPASLIGGLIIGHLTQDYWRQEVIDGVFTFSLIVLYICVGISQGENKEVFHFLRILGLKILWLPGAILVGSIGGGILAGLILDLPMHVSVVSASGMSFYSITGAYMTQTFGLEIGTYGFIVNVLREFFTILLMPFLIKISFGSPIAGGAAGDMDTMLAPVTKFVGVRLGLVTLITGTILTFIVPFLLPVVAGIFQG